MSSRETMASSALVSPDREEYQPGEREQHLGGEVNERGGWRDRGPEHTGDRAGGEVAGGLDRGEQSECRAA